jgi:hypothetical protein
MSENFRKLEEFYTLSKLRQGYKVMDVEKQTLLTLASGAEAEARLVDTVIAGPRTSLLELYHSRELLLGAASQARSLVAPIRKLPPEILAEIFILAHSDSIYFSYKGWWSPSLAVITGKICALWRHVAISTPKLWTCITYALLHKDFPRQVVQRLGEVLELSGNVLLDITVKCPYSRRCPAGHLILQHSQRWKSLVLEGHSSFFARCFRGGLDSATSSRSGPATVLSSLQVPSLSILKLLPSMASNNRQAVRHSPVHIPSASAPNLREVTIGGVNYEGISYDLPWGQLDTLQFGVSRHLAEFFDMMSKSTSVGTDPEDCHLALGRWHEWIGGNDVFSC